jgi:hypothetical protein
VTKTRYGWCLAALVLVVGAGGCSSRLVRVSGRLTYKGQPVPSTLVTFQPDQRGARASHGLTDDNGNFTLTYSRDEVGATRGHDTVSLRYIVSAEEEMGTIKPKASKELKEVIARYGNVETSPLHYDITSNGQFIEINLE